MHPDLVSNRVPTRCVMGSFVYLSLKADFMFYRFFRLVPGADITNIAKQVIPYSDSKSENTPHKPI
jgi:hypothetical protein